VAALIYHPLQVHARVPDESRDLPLDPAGPALAIREVSRPSLTPGHAILCRSTPKHAGCYGPSGTHGAVFTGNPEITRKTLKKEIPNFFTDLRALEDGHTIASCEIASNQLPSVRRLGGLSRTRPIPYLYKITLTPIEIVDQPGKFGSVIIVAQCDGKPDKCWNLTPYELAGALVGFFSERDISGIEEHLHSGNYIFLPNSYSATELAEMGYRLGH
jgi:hypothetical protein